MIEVMRVLLLFLKCLVIRVDNSVCVFFVGRFVVYIFLF